MVVSFSNKILKQVVHEVPISDVEVQTFLFSFTSSSCVIGNKVALQIIFPEKSIAIRFILHC